MPRAYRAVRDHLDDVVALVGCMLRRLDAREGLAELELEIVGRGEQIESSLALARVRQAPLPLDRLRNAFGLEAAELHCLYVLVALGVSQELRDLAGRDNATLELLDRLIYAEHRDRFADHLGDDGRLFGYGLIEYVDESTRSRFARPVRASDRIVELALGRDVPTLGAHANLTDSFARDLVVPAQARDAVRVSLKRHVDCGVGPFPVIRGPLGSGRRALVSSIAHELGRSVLVVDCGSLPDRVRPMITSILREAILARAVIVLANAEQLSGDRAAAFDIAFAGYRGPLAITLGPVGSAATLTARRGATVVDLPPLSERERAALWIRFLPETLAAEAAARYRVTGGQIEHAGRNLVDREATLADVHAAIRATVDGKLELLGVRIEWKQTWADLVLPPDSRGELDEMVSRVRHRRRVVEDWGFGAKVARGLGVAALFSGPPGTGKTMAAGLVAAELGLDLYQIDVSRMVSKYVGETEKNLAEVFDAAETGHAVLLFDEADAMFAKRTEVKSSNDRYANLEVNYLLQRMEGFTGITILTTNHDAAIDEAFRRRLAFRIAFPMPDEDERAQLWRAVIPARALASNIDFNQLASRFVMSGGYIKNAAVRAAYLAAHDGALIEMRHLLKASVAEYVAMGKIMASSL